MEQFKQFSVEKQAAIKALEELKGILLQLDNIGLDVQADLEKIASALDSVQDDVLRIALLGAFSDGKTSVIAAWLGKIMDDMKIDTDESSDALAIYKPEGLPEKCEIIDTPGLFGDKEKEVDGKQVMYEEVTRRYISEAHLVLYVVDATNPLKDSHSEIVKWVLRDLDKLDSTVFVINKMDEVTDLTDQALFDDQAEIKKDNLKSKLQRVANLSSEELDRLTIVCMASNPSGRGLEFWFGKPEQYESRSRINDLKQSTNQILDQSVPEALIAKAGLDVARDLVTRRVEDARNEVERLEIFAEQRDQESKRIREDLDQGRKEVKQLAAELFRELQTMENGLLGKLRPLSQEDIKPFLEDEIGISDEESGYKLQTNIKVTVDRYFDQASVVTKRIERDIDNQLNSSQRFLESVSDDAFKSVGKAVEGISKVNPAAIKSTIFAARDALGKATGYVFKFKPWQATKWAANVSKWSGPIGAAVSLASDAYGMYKEHDAEQELIKTKEQIADLIKGTFKDLYDILGDDTKLMEFFAPQLKDFESMVQELDEVAHQIRASQEALSQIEGQLGQLMLPGGENSTA